MTISPDILVVGATGSTGRATTDCLTARGIPFRSMSRRSPSVEFGVQADLDDARSVRTALEGVRAAYLVTPSTERAETQQKQFIDIAVAAGVSHLVLLSQLGSVVDSPVRFLRYHAAVEQHALASGIGITALRPNLFMQGMLALAGIVKTTGKLPAPIGEARVSLVDVRDIGDVATLALTSPKPLGAVTLTGGEALTHIELAARLSSATGHQIHFEDVPPERFGKMLSGVLPPWQVKGLLEDYAHYARGEAAAISTAVPDLLKHPARDFATFAREHAALFRRK
ncbi:NmrA family NAD(P)-binding protein [Arthrobacter sp. Helios]|uniref:NmrA family NAD(P)-binding protein n=1 Tax=Arthrobacter sp. Helios TaxID=2828862 RepID=UPI00206F1187|nr:NmrA family NAD(P)-binding protein [Arthrobacter sp. Helios]UPO78436.1 NmrA family NAD(P)-binding protein [Arthrobacter sp. Helios]